MFWVLVFGGIAVAGLVMLIGYAVWLAHKTADVLSEVTVVTDRLGDLGVLMAQIQPQGATSDDASSLRRTTGQDELRSE